MTGARGNVGAPLVRLLADAGADVRALTRKRASFPDGVEVAQGDLARPDDLLDALDDVDSVFLMSGGFALADHAAAMATAASKAGVRHIVLMTSLGVEAGGDDPIVTMNAEAECAVHDFGGSWTVLRPGAFATDTMRWADAIRAGEPIREPFASVRTAPIDPADVALVAACVLTGTGHEGKTYRLTGPDALLPEEQVRIVGDVIGKQVAFEELGEDEARAGMSHYLPAAIVDTLLKQSRREGPWSRPLPTVAELTHTPPTTFRQWVADHADLFQ
ncbi:MAG TPA: NAD(P)H-binding protein [Pseudonocardiaceae bacterium]|nr:NAD(P)H-binding protein [Pseudonocardiaceae bacterium]